MLNIKCIREICLAEINDVFQQPQTPFNCLQGIGWQSVFIAPPKMRG
jgi:hypothetical protein